MPPRGLTLLLLVAAVCCWVDAAHMRRRDVERMAQKALSDITKDPAQMAGTIEVSRVDKPKFKVQLVLTCICRLTARPNTQLCDVATLTGNAVGATIPISELCKHMRNLNVNVTALRRNEKYTMTACEVPTAVSGLLHTDMSTFVTSCTRMQTIMRKYHPSQFTYRYSVWAESRMWRCELPIYEQKRRKENQHSRWMNWAVLNGLVGMNAPPDSGRVGAETQSRGPLGGIR